MPLSLADRTTHDLASSRFRIIDQRGWSPVIVDPKSATPRVTATVELLSRYFRPWLFLVICVGEPPHEGTRQYRVAAPDEAAAAFKGIDLYIREFTTSPIIKTMAPLAPKAKLQ